MIYVLFSIFMLLLVISFGRYGSESVNFRKKVSELEAEAARLSAVLKKIVIERDDLISRTNELATKLISLERDYKYLTKSDSLVKEIAALYDKKDTLLTTEDWRNSLDPVFSEFVSYIESTNISFDKKLN